MTLSLSISASGTWWHHDTAGPAPGRPTCPPAGGWRWAVPAARDRFMHVNDEMREAVAEAAWFDKEAIIARNQRMARELPPFRWYDYAQVTDADYVHLAASVSTRSTWGPAARRPPRTAPMRTSRASARSTCLWCRTT